MGVTIMEVNRIDENTIRVRIDKKELEDRGLKVLDLLGDKGKIQRFFYSILDEVDTDHTFGNNVPVTFQVMPNNGGLDLLISKVNGMRPGDFQKMLKPEATENSMDPQEAQDKSQAPHFFDLNPKDDDKVNLSNPNLVDEEELSDSEIEEFWKFQNHHAYEFDDLGALIELADNLKVNDLASSLYYEDGKYYLELAFLNEIYPELKPADAWAIANEYGININDEKLDAIKCTSKCILYRDALNSIRTYFCKAC